MRRPSPVVGDHDGSASFHGLVHSDILAALRSLHASSAPLGRTLPIPDDLMPHICCL